MIIRKDSIDRIELIKIRTLGEKPKLDPPLKKAGAASVAAGAVKAPPADRGGKIRAPEVDDHVRDNVRMILSRLKLAAPDQKAGLVKDLARQERAAPYLASLLPGLDPDPAAFLGEALLLMKDPACQIYLVEALESPKPHVRIVALDLLAGQGNAERVEPVRQCLEDPVPGVKVAAMNAVTRLGDGQALRPMLDHLGSEDVVVRAAAINNSLTLGHRLGRMNDVHEGVRLALVDARGGALLDLIWAAGRTGKKDLWGLVASYAYDGDPKLRGAVMEALTALAAPESIDVVAQRLRIEDDKAVRVRLAAAAEALKHLQAVPPLIDWLRSNDPDIVNAAVKSLQSITRQKFGKSYDKWDDWWQSTQRK
jgi:HEAT repeat protein